MPSPSLILEHGDQDSCACCTERKVRCDQHHTSTSVCVFKSTAAFRPGPCPRAHPPPHRGLDTTEQQLCFLWSSPHLDHVPCAVHLVGGTLFQLAGALGPSPASLQAPSALLSLLKAHLPLSGGPGLQFLPHHVRLDLSLCYPVSSYFLRGCEAASTGSWNSEKGVLSEAFEKERGYVCLRHNSILLLSSELCQMPDNNEH